MSKALGLDSDTIFGIISGGIRHVTPTTFLYKIDTENLGDWTYIGPLVNFGLNFSPSRWSGDLGKNWEVTNFLTMNDEIEPSITYDFLIMGTEGCLEDTPEGPRKDGDLSRPSRGQLWMSGCLQKSNDSGAVTSNYEFGGHFDHGCLYAANSFLDPRSKRHIVWGWITEEDLCDEFRHQQGWSGLMSMPRQIQIQTLHNVTGALASMLSSITSVHLKKDESGAVTLRTLASEPYQPLVEYLRGSPYVRQFSLGRLALDSNEKFIELPWDEPRSNHWELQCSFTISKSCSKVGLSIGHTKGTPDHPHVSNLRSSNTDRLF
jgi:beta-fructofuranosidase